MRVHWAERADVPPGLGFRFQGLGFRVRERHMGLHWAEISDVRPG